MTGKPSKVKKGWRGPRLHRFSYRRKMSVAMSKVWTTPLQSPEGIVYIKITNLKAFAEAHGLDPTGLREVMLGNYKQHRGYKSVGPDEVSEAIREKRSRYWAPSDDDPFVIGPDGSEYYAPPKWVFLKEYATRARVDVLELEALFQRRLPKLGGWRWSDYTEGETWSP